MQNFEKINSVVLRNLFALTNIQHKTPSFQVSPHFKLGELACNAKGLPFQDAVPASQMIVNIYESLVFAETLRYMTGKPVIINSAYRTSQYNKSIGGVDLSAHVLFKALDIRRIETMDYFGFYNLCEKTASYLEDMYGFFIRLGKYTSQDFVHVDCDRTKFAKRWSK